MKAGVIKVYHPREEVEKARTHGQCWRGEKIEESIGLCRYQSIGPTLEKYLPRDGKILEAGCGTGRWVFYLLRKGYDIVGIDLANEAVAIAKEYDSTVPITMDDIVRTKFPDGYFRAVISLGVVEHFEEGPQKPLQEIKRLLTQDGMLFITVPIQNPFRMMLINHLKRAKMYLRKLMGYQYLFEEYRFTRKRMIEILKEEGFDIIEMVADDFSPPKSLGLYIDLPFLRHKTNKWELNWLGNFISSILRSISPWFIAAGALWVCKVKR